MYTKLIIRFQGLWNKRRKRYIEITMFMHYVHFIRHLYTCIYSSQLMYMGWTQSNIYLSSDFKIGYTSSFYLFENKNVSNLDTNLINEASSLSVTGNLCPWNSFFLIKQNNYPSFYFYCILNLLTGIQIENVTILHELYVYTPVPWYDKNNQ